jgi:hypothetical protein
MRNKTLIAVTVLAACVPICRAEDDYEIKVYPCQRTDDRIVIDGALNEQAWQEAVLVGRFTYYNKPEPVAAQTSFRALYDAKRLYLGIQCDEPTIDRVSPVQHARDTHAVFHGETIEIFIDPNHDHADYYQIAVSVAGSIYDSARTNASWSADVVARTRIEKEGWSLELSVPWTDLGVTPKPGMVVGLNVCRDRYVSHGREWSNWSQTKANFHDPKRFGHLVLSPTPEQLGALGPQFRKGGRRGPIVIYSKSGFAQMTYREIARRAIAKLEPLIAGLDEAAAQEADPKARANLQQRIAAHRKEIAGFKRQIDSQAGLDAAAWARMEHRLAVLAAKLEQVIWDARLSALLSGI